MSKNIAIIGSGPAGIVAAISASLHSKHDGNIFLFESLKDVCKTILATGNGRCNFSNVVLDIDRFNNPHFVNEFRRFSDLGEDVVSILESFGLEWMVNDAGLMFPLSNKASSVRDVLVGALGKSDVKVVADRQISFISELCDFDAVIIATGHRACADLLSGIKCFPMRRVLCPIKTRENVSVADNVRSRVNLKVIRTLKEANKSAVFCESAQDRDFEQLVFEEDGEVQFRKYGISGIVTFNASRYVLPGDKLVLDFASPIVTDDIKNHLQARYEKCSGDLDLFFKGFLHVNLARLIKARIKKKDSFEEVFNLVTSFELTVVEIFEDEKLSQVSRGGIDVNYVSPSTLEVMPLEKVVNNKIFACGEVLDIDGPCGGYNLTWCFESGWRAGKSTAQLV